MRAPLVLTTVLVAGAVLAGCQTSTPGTPTTTAPTTSAPTTTAPQAGPVSPPAAQVLPPDNSGYVFIETKSGQTRCQLDEKSVGCEAQFTNTPIKDGVRTNGVNLSSDGSVEWIVGNLGDIPAVPIDYRTYSAVGWTIAAAEDGTRFTNQKTGHGMFVSIDKVDTF
jgi:hypothetical protein